MQSFSNARDEVDFYKKLEAANHRPPGEGVTHPDACPTIKIRGIAWSIPPRGQQLVPTFTESGSVDLSYPAVEEWPEVIAVLKAIKLPDEPVCKECGQPTATAFDATDDLLAALFALAARALRAQYNLSNAELSALLRFSTDQAPEWLTELIRWSTGSQSRHDVVDPLYDEQPLFDDQELLGAIPDNFDPGAIWPSAPSQRPPRKRRRRRRRRKKVS